MCTVTAPGSASPEETAATATAHELVPEAVADPLHRGRRRAVSFHTGEPRLQIAQEPQATRGFARHHQELAELVEDPLGAQFREILTRADPDQLFVGFHLQAGCELHHP